MRSTLFAVLLAAASAVPGAAQEVPAPELQTNVNSIWFNNWIGLSNASLRVASPDGTIDTIVEATRSPTYRLTGSPIVNGVYRYELRAARKGADTLYMTGGFLVRNGAVVNPRDLPAEERAD